MDSGLIELLQWPDASNTSTRMKPAFARRVLMIKKLLYVSSRSLHMHHLTCGISSLLHTVNLILFTLLLVHLILHISPHHSHHLRSHHLSLPLPFTPDLKLISFTNPIVTLIPSGLPSRISTCTVLKGHWRCLF